MFRASARRACQTTHGHGRVAGRPAPCRPAGTAKVGTQTGSIGAHAGKRLLLRALWKEPRASARSARRWLSPGRTDMLRITTHFTDDEHVLQLEGCLAGPWVRELARAWGVAMTASHREHVALDLKDVCYIDDAGRVLLAAMHREGVRVAAAGLVARELVREIAQAAAGEQRS
jgi:hypothetical protein